MPTDVKQCGALALLDQLIYTFTISVFNDKDESHEFDLLLESMDNYWWKENKLPQGMGDSYVLTIDGCSFIIFHVAPFMNPHETNAESRNLESYICNPFKNEYIKLKLINDCFPDIFDSDNCHHEKIIDVTHIHTNLDDETMRYYIDIGYNWKPEQKNDDSTKYGNFIYKIIVNMKLNSIKYINLLTMSNSPISKDNDLRIITTLNGQHVVKLNDNIYMITGGYMSWSTPTDILLFNAQSYEYKKYQNVIPYKKPDDWYEPDRSQGLVQRNTNEFILWNGFQCFLMKLEGNNNTNYIVDNIQFLFKEINFIELKTNILEQVQFSSFVKYKQFIICIGGLHDEGDNGEWIMHDMLYLFDMNTLKWSSFKNIKIPTVLSGNSSIISRNKYNGDVIVNVIGGVRWEDDDVERMRYSYLLDNHRKLYLGIDKNVRCKIWNIFKLNDILPRSLWIVVFDMIDDGLFCVYHKPYQHN